MFPTADKLDRVAIARLVAVLVEIRFVQIDMKSGESRFASIDSDFKRQRLDFVYLINFNPLHFNKDSTSFR